MTFEQRFPVGRNHLDSNLHLRKIAYVDLASSVRLAYLAAAGFSSQTFARLLSGPVIRLTSRTRADCALYGPSWG